MPTKPRRQFRHFLHEFRKLRARKSQYASVGERAATQGVILHSGKRKSARDFARVKIPDQRFAAKFAAPLELALQQHKHPVCWVALSRVNLPGLQMEVFHLTEEPLDLIVGNAGECGNLPHSDRMHPPLDLAQVLMNELDRNRSFAYA